MIGRWLSKLAPAYLKAEAVLAEEDAAQARTVLAAVIEQQATVDDLAERMEQDRVQNRYAQRVSAAMGGTP